MATPLAAATAMCEPLREIATSRARGGAPGGGCRVECTYCCGSGTGRQKSVVGFQGSGSSSISVSCESRHIGADASGPSAARHV